MIKDISVSRLYELVQTNRIPTKLISKINLLLEAINDWPTKTVSVEDFFGEVKSFLRVDNIEYNSINSKMSQLDPDAHSWQLESLTSLIEILESEKDKNIDEIIKDFFVEAE